MDKEYDRTGKAHGFMQLKLYSNYPFREREDSPPTHKFGKDALEHFEKTDDKVGPFYKFDKYIGVRALRYATPLIMNKRCMSCHNDKETYPTLGKTDWKEGDVRGVLEIVVPLEESFAQTRATLFNTYSLLGGGAVTLLALSWSILKLGARQQT